MISRPPSEAVVLLHGLGANRFVMTRLATYLDAQGYRVANWGYRSIRDSIESHAQVFQKRISDFLSHHRCDRLHVVTHSMGGIVARRAFSIGRPGNLGRFVMLGPPNSGSHIARRLAASLGRFCPPLHELSDAADSYVNRLDQPTGIDLGIIAAELDRVVKLTSTFLECQRDHIVLPGHHGMLPWRRDTAKQVEHFLRYGQFCRDTLKESLSDRTTTSIPTATTRLQSGSD